MYRYAMMLDFGQGVPVDKKKAVEYYKLAAGNGNIEAMFDYAFHCSIGDVIQKDTYEAIRYYEMAANKGHEDAKYNYEQLTGKKFKPIKYYDLDYYSDDE